MRKLSYIVLLFIIGGCAGRDVQKTENAPAQVGIVNHTGNYIYSASVDGDGGGFMEKWRGGHANICCASIPVVWHPGIVVLVRWNMPVGHDDVFKEKYVEIEKYDGPGDIYLHFFPNDIVRVVVSNYAGFGKHHPIPPPEEPVEMTVKEGGHD